MKHYFRPYTGSVNYELIESMRIEEYNTEENHMIAYGRRGK
jgi:hypothetical protein